MTAFRAQRIIQVLDWSPTFNSSLRRQLKSSCGGVCAWLFSRTPQLVSDHVPTKIERVSDDASRNAYWVPLILAPAAFGRRCAKSATSPRSKTRSPLSHFLFATLWIHHWLLSSPQQLENSKSVSRRQCKRMLQRRRPALIDERQKCCSSTSSPPFNARHSLMAWVWSSSMSAVVLWRCCKNSLGTSTRTTRDGRTFLRYQATRGAGPRGHGVQQIL